MNTNEPISTGNPDISVEDRLRKYHEWFKMLHPYMSYTKKQFANYMNLLKLFIIKHISHNQQIVDTEDFKIFHSRDASADDDHYVNNLMIMSTDPEICSLFYRYKQGIYILIVVKTILAEAIANEGAFILSKKLQTSHCMYFDTSRMDTKIFEIVYFYIYDMYQHDYSIYLQQINSDIDPPTYYDTSAVEGLIELSGL